MIAVGEDHRTHVAGVRRMGRREASWLSSCLLRLPNIALSRRILHVCPARMEEPDDPANYRNQSRTSRKFS